MVHFIPVENEMDAQDWCNSNGYKYMGTFYRDGNYVLQYDDGNANIMTSEEEAYYERMIALQEKEAEKLAKKEAESKQVWIIASDDGVYSRMYKGNGRGEYTFYINQAKTYTKSGAQKTAAIMTKNSRVGRQWFGLRIK